MLSSVEVKEGAASKSGVEYGIANLEEKKFSGRQSRGRDPEHHWPGMRSKQGLMSLKKVTRGWQTEWCLTKRDAQSFF